MLSVHSRYGPPARGLPEADLRPVSSGGSVTLTAVTVATGVGRSFPGQGLHLLDVCSFHDALRIPTSAIRHRIWLPLRPRQPEATSSQVR